MAIDVFYAYAKPGYFAHAPAAVHGVRWSSFFSTPCLRFSPDLKLQCCLEHGHPQARCFAVSKAGSLMAEWTPDYAGTVPSVPPGTLNNFCSQNPWVLADQVSLVSHPPATAYSPCCFTPHPRGTPSPCSCRVPPTIYFCYGCYKPISACACKKSSARPPPLPPVFLSISGRYVSAPAKEPVWAEVGPQPTPGLLDRCECGSAKALGSVRGGAGHSDWCPWFEG